MQAPLFQLASLFAIDYGGGANGLSFALLAALHI